MAQKMSTNSEYSSLSSQFRTKFDNFATNAIHAGFESGDHSGFPVVLPISTSTTFKQPDPDKLQVFFDVYTNITHWILQCHPYKFSAGLLL